MGAGTPTLPGVTNSAADALSDTLDAGTGATYLKANTDETDNPSQFNLLTVMQQWMFLLMAGAAIGGKVVKVATPLQIGVEAAEYSIAGTAKSFGGETGLTLNANKTTYVYLDAAATIKTSESAFPADVLQLAEVTTDSSVVSAIKDVRMRNLGIGSSNSWYSVAAAGAVDINDNTMTDVGKLDFSAPAPSIPITAGAITVTKTLHEINGSTGTTLSSISAGSVGQLLILRTAAGNGSITIQHTADTAGSISLAGGVDFVMTDTQGAEWTDMILLVYDADTTWHEIARTRQPLSALVKNLDVAGYDLSNVGKLNFGTPDAVTIATGAIDITGKDSYLKLDSEGGAGVADDLDTINGPVAGDVLLLTRGNANVTLKHNTGNLILPNGVDILLGDIFHTVMLVPDALGVTWSAMPHTRFTTKHLIQSGYNVPHPIVVQLPGALAAGVQKFRTKFPYPIVIQDAYGYARTGPAGGPMVAHIHVNGVSIHANDADAINIADGTNDDTSAVEDHLVAAGAYIEIEIMATSGSPNGAADLTIAVNGFARLEPDPTD